MKNFIEAFIWGLFGVLALTFIGTCSSGAQSREPELHEQLVGTARKPLVLVGQQTEQLPTADYLSSVGGASFNGTPPTAAGDIEVTTINGSAPTTGSGLYAAIMSATPTSTSTGLTTWGNQPAGCTATNNTLGFDVTCPAQASVTNATSRLATAPATPYSIKMLVGTTHTMATNSGPLFGWVKSGTGGKSVLASWLPSGGAGNQSITVNYFNTWTSFNSTQFSSGATVLTDHVVWFKLSDDGTVATMSYSGTGDVGDWNTFFSVTKSGSFLGTYDQISFGAGTFNGACSAEILSWTVTSP